MWQTIGYAKRLCLHAVQVGCVTPKYFTWLNLFHAFGVGFQKTTRCKPWFSKLDSHFKLFRDIDVNFYRLNQRVFIWDPKSQERVHNFSCTWTRFPPAMSGTGTHESLWLLKTLILILQSLLQVSVNRELNWTSTTAATRRENQIGWRRKTNRFLNLVCRMTTCNFQIYGFSDNVNAENS